MRKFIEYMALSFISAHFLSCTVLENRSDCPCRLTVSLENLVGKEPLYEQAGTYNVAITISNDDHIIYSESVNMNNYTSPLEILVPKGELLVTATLGIVRSGRTADVIYIMQGQDSDPLYAWSESLLAGETAYVKPSLHKQYTAVNLVLDEPKPSDGLSTFNLRVKAGISGLNLDGLKPVCGTFEYEINAVSPGCICSFNLPRLNDSALSAEIYESKDGSMSIAIDLASYLIRSGYDWNAADLADINLQLEFENGSASINILPWDEEENSRNIRI